MQTSERTYKIVLLLIGGGVIAMSLWGGFALFSSHFSTVIASPRVPVSFSPKTEAWDNTLFNSLRAYVTGKVVSGALGKPLPFEAGGGALLNGQVSRLASMEEVLLSGARAVSLSRAADGSMFVLLGSLQSGGEHAYEIRSYSTDGSASTFAVWETEPGGVLVTRIAAAGDGSVWLGGSSGSVGHCSLGETPNWFSASSTGLAGSVSDVAVDGAGSVWATDGAGVAFGGAVSFSPYDLFSKMSAEDRQGMTALSSIRFNVLLTGEVGLVADRAAFIVPLAQQNWLRRVGANMPAAVPLAFHPGGDLFVRDASTGDLVRVWATGTAPYPSSVSPKEARSVPALFATGQGALYALDYAPPSTVLWTNRGGDWFAEIVAASGTVPGDAAISIAADGSGSVWSILKNGQLLRIRRGSAP